MIQTKDVSAAPPRNALALARAVAGGTPEPAEVAAFCEQLVESPPAVQRHALRAVKPILAAAAFGELAMRARRAWNEDDLAPRDAAYLLLECARAVPASSLPKALRADLRAEAWAMIANRRRLDQDFAGADLAWRRARVLLDLGTGDTRQIAELAAMQAALRRAQRRFGEARDLLQLAKRQYERIRDPNGLGQVMLSSAYLRFIQGDTNGAFEEAYDLLRKTNGRKKPERAMHALHLMWACFIDRGEYERALDWYHLYDVLYGELGGMFALRADWLKGRLFVGLRKWREAESYFEPLRKEFLARGLEFDAALVGIELAMCYAEERDLAGVRRLAQEMYPVFCSHKLPEEASAVLIVFARTATAYKLKIAQLYELGDEIKQLARTFGR